jgi:hypothetical protein
MDTSSMVLKSYVGDLTDAELLRRPGPGCNHVAWQLGHLISSCCSLVDSLVPGAAPKLPEGFAAAHSKETVGSDDPAKFRTKQEYLDLYDKVHAAAMEALARQSEADLDKPGPENFRSMFPTAGAMWVLVATHPLMHAGQIVPLRRALGKPVVI